MLRREIAAGGPVPFDRFMGLALYHSAHGYYERATDTIGRAGDYLTSVCVGPLLGELLGWQFSQWQAEAGGGAWRIVEGGAHDGRLAEDILTYLRGWQPRWSTGCEYWIVEPSARRRARQRARLDAFAPQVRWWGGWEEVQDRSVDGVVFANELLDALPVRRFGWIAAERAWREWLVGWEGDRLVWVRGSAAISAPPGGVPGGDGGLEAGGDGRHPPVVPGELMAVLPDGFTLEWGPEQVGWWRAAARRLARGRLVGLDYGWTWWERFTPPRAGGTLRGYRSHRLVSDVLEQPGGCDLTAAVDFTAVEQAGRSEGLQTEELASQASFLARVAEGTWRAPREFPEWTSARRRQLQTLIHPDHFGRAFRVLIQRR